MYLVEAIFDVCFLNDPIGRVFENFAHEPFEPERRFLVGDELSHRGVLYVVGCKVKVLVVTWKHQEIVGDIVIGDIVVVETVVDGILVDIVRHASFKGQRMGLTTLLMIAQRLFRTKVLIARTTLNVIQLVLTYMLT